MSFPELFLIGVGLSMDAFAVAVCKGLGMKRIDWRQTLVIALFFGGFQALMPLAGWALGSGFAALVEPVGHWIAFGLLAYVGGKMLWDALRGDGEDGGSDGTDGGSGAPRLDVAELLMLAVATSIDALAVGVGFAFLQVDIVPAVSVIGCTTFVLSLAGVAAGNRFGARYERPATIVGGVVLVLLGAKILIEHLTG